MKASQISLLSCIIIIILIVLPQQIGSPIFAYLSPSFPLGEIRDDINNQNNDRVNLGLNKTGDYPDIQLVDYISDAHFFNATIWFTSPTTNYQLTCGMFIDADSKSETGYGGMEYELMATVDVQNREKVGRWKQALIEHSSTFDFFKVIREEEYLGVLGKSTYSEFNEPNSRYCPLSLDLSAINSPDKYRVLFYTHMEGKALDKAIDFTNWVDIPPPYFSVITNPNPLVLRPDDEQAVPIQVKSTSTPIDSIINLTLSNNNNDYRSNSEDSDKPIISIEKIPHPILRIHIPKNALGVYQIPLKVTVSTESLVPKVPINPLNTTGKRYEISSVYPARGYITGPTNLTLTVLQPLDWTQKFKAFWDVFGQPISIIIGGFAGGATSLLFDRFKGSKKKKNESKWENSDYPG